MRGQECADFGGGTGLWSRHHKRRTHLVVYRLAPHSTPSLETEPRPPLAGQIYQPMVLCPPLQVYEYTRHFSSCLSVRVRTRGDMRTAQT